MRSKEESHRRKQSRSNFIKMAMERGVPKAQAALFFDQEQAREALEPSLPDDNEMLARELGQNVVEFKRD